MTKELEKLIEEIEKELPVDFKKQAWWGNLRVILIPQALNKSYRLGQESVNLPEEAALQRIQQVVDKQAEDEGLWFRAVNVI